MIRPTSQDTAEKEVEILGAYESLKSHHYVESHTQKLSGSGPSVVDQQNCHYSRVASADVDQLDPTAPGSPQRNVTWLVNHDKP